MRNRNSNEVRRTNHGQFAWLYKVLCQEKSVKPLSAIQAYLPEGCLRFCVDRIALKDWSPILKSIAENRSVPKIYIYSRSRCKRVREKVNSEEKLEKLWRCRGKDAARPILYTNFLLRCLVDSIAVCARDGSVITSLTLDGIPLTPKYLNILCAGLKCDEKLTHLSLTRCRIGDAGCDLLLACLSNNPNLCLLNLSSCRLSNRSALYISLFLKRRKADLLQNIWEQSSLQSEAGKSDNKQPQGLQTLILDQNPKIRDVGVRQLTFALKSDVWLQYLSLRHCGVTKHGAEIMVRLLQTNSVITKLDLTENHIPINTLQMVLRILKRRQDMMENVTLKKRFRRDWRRKVLRRRIRGPRRKDRRHRRHRTERFRKYSLQRPSRRWKILRFERRAKQSSKEAQNPKGEHCSRRKKLNELESQLLYLIHSNSKLKEELTNNKTLLDTEAQHRSKMETELQKVSLRLNNLKSKVVMLNCSSSNTCTENQLLDGFKYLLEKLEPLSTAKQEDDNDINRDDVVLSTMKPLWSTPLAHPGENNFANCLQRSLCCPPLKI